MRPRSFVVIAATLGVIVGSLVGFANTTRSPQPAGREVENSATAADRLVASTTTRPGEPRTTRPPATVPQRAVSVTAVPATTIPPTTIPSTTIALPGTSARHPSSFVVADATVAAVPLFSSPGDPMADRAAVTNPTWEGLPLVFLVKEQRDTWLKVLVASRPNGMDAWIRSVDVTLRHVPHWIRVELGARRATVFSGDTAVFDTAVATGRPSTPTPTGLYFVDGVVRLADPSGVYGYGQMSVSAFSEVFETFGGGIGQIALHGTNAPNLLGQTVSNGCVRFDNDAIERVMDLAPTGTPVEIIA